MTMKIKQIRERDNTAFCPRTHVSAVVDDNGTTVADLLDANEDKRTSIDVSELNSATYATFALALAAVPADYQQDHITQLVYSDGTDRHTYQRSTAAWSTTTTDWYLLFDCKAIKDCFEKSGERIVINVPTTWESGIANPDTTWINTNINYVYSTRGITVKAGDIIKLENNTILRSVRVVSDINNVNSTIVGLGSTNVYSFLINEGVTGLVVSTNADYTGDILIDREDDSYVLSDIKPYKADLPYLHDTVSNIGVINSLIGPNRRSVEVTRTSGYVYFDAEAMVDHESFSHSQNIHCLGNSIVYATIPRGREDGIISVVSIYNKGIIGKGSYTPLIRTDTQSSKTYEVFIPHECDIVISWYTTSVSGVNIEIVELGKINNINSAKQDGPLFDLNKIPTHISCFKKITCIGDSLTQGVLEYTQDGVNLPTLVEGVSYPSYLSKHTQVTTVNLGIGSRCASRQVTSEPIASTSWYDYAVSQGWTEDSNNIGDIAIIALGTNDVTKQMTIGDIDNDINFTDRNLNARTFVGGYANIIQWLKEVKPKIKIFVITISNVRNDFNESTITLRNQYSNVIKAMASKFENVYVIDLQKYAETTIQEQQHYKAVYQNGHNNALGYELRARQIISYIDYIIENNFTSFRNLQFIDSDKEYIIT